MVRSALLLLSFVFFAACSGASSESTPDEPEPAPDPVDTTGGDETGSSESGNTNRAAADLVIADPPPEDAPSQTLRGMIRGPYAVTEACGSCGTGMKLVTGDGYEHDFTHAEELGEAVRRCMAVGAWVEITGRFVDAPGSCGEGSCRAFAAEALGTECEPPNDETITFHSGSYAQCLGTTRQAAECIELGAECSLLAMVEHPCANSGARCVPERERARGAATRQCECSCSQRYRQWRQRLDANRPRQPRP
jgi:hypothetical protein